MTTKSRPAPFRIPVSHDGKRGLILQVLDESAALMSLDGWVARKWPSWQLLTSIAIEVTLGPQILPGRTRLEQQPQHSAD